MTWRRAQHSPPTPPWGAQVMQRMGAGDAGELLLQLRPKAAAALLKQLGPEFAAGAMPRQARRAMSPHPCHPTSPLAHPHVLRPAPTQA